MFDVKPCPFHCKGCDRKPSLTIHMIGDNDKELIEIIHTYGRPQFSLHIAQNKPSNCLIKVESPPWQMGTEETINWWNSIADSEVHND